jgi:hypothetical protein
MSAFRLGFSSVDPIPITPYPQRGPRVPQSPISNPKSDQQQSALLIKLMIFRVEHRHHRTPTL